MMTRDQIQTVLDALEYIKLHVPFSDEDGTMYSESAIAILTAALAEPSEPKTPEIFCGVDFADGLLCVSVMRRRPDAVAEVLHCEQIELPLRFLQKVLYLHGGD